jgi:glycosyltransferase involved in cell wall biosynthesis
MKIIGLMPVKNEEWILDITIPQLKLFVDELLVLDVESNDKTIEILKKHNVHVKHQPYHPVNLSKWRQTLLDWGRKRGGTHFVWLDADEAFTTNYLSTFKQDVTQLKPGQKLVLDWLCVWGSPYKMRNDNSVWSDLSKDFVVCDDKTSNFADTKLHEGRTPGSNDEKNIIKVSKNIGAVLHYQFVALERFHMKQAFQRCRELVMHNADPLTINQKYSITLDDKNITCVDIPKNWINGIPHLEKLINAPVDWYYPAILDLFSKHGIQFFEPLQIWHIPELYDEFIKQIGRKPKPILKPAIHIRIKNHISMCIPKPIKTQLKKLIKK